MASVAVIALLGVGVLTQTDFLTPVEEPVAAPVEAAIAPTVAEPEVTAEAVIVTEPVVVETAVVDSGTRPVLRPEDLVIVEPAASETALEEPAIEEVAAAEPAAPDLPEPLVTPDMIKDAASSPELPGFLAEVAIATDTPTPVLALPETPAEVTPSQTELTLDILALVPGNEIQPEPEPEAIAAPAPVIIETDDSVADVADRDATGTVATVAEAFFILSAWSVDLPFRASEPNSNVIAEAGFIAPLWVSEGVTVTSVNGIAIDRIADIPKVLRENLNPGESTEVSVSFGIEKNGIAATHDWEMPIRQDYQLLNGVAFSAFPSGDSWATVVTAIPAGIETELEVGDTLIAYIPNSTKLETRTALKDLFDSEVASGTTQFSFAVNRDESMWVAGLEYNTNPEND